MILLTKLGKEKKEIVINAELIETIEENPDTVINLTTGKKFLVNEKKEEIIEKIIKYRKSIQLI
ncbi:flagellar protein FlbD [Hypnocyclicus thermotrophus]|uniref:Flagellar protein FlbD n=1 Tax=Hypnocyclicus thermotrophus TaxID=1627895 RepID=A0AA46DY07_9FUSO|nr:flagellar FlbD family protein [Hypnocyclicus thermotrophus]TDT68551.1 flagellar protein FlbD [Hypnocyclicus thermotrophus]